MKSANPYFIHAADLHLGAPLKSLGKQLSLEAKANLIALVGQAFDNLIELCLSESAEFLVLSGDIYDGANREAAAQLKFERGLKRLVDADIKVYIVHGNHDPLSDDVLNIVRLPEGVHVFKPGDVQVVKHTLRDGTTVSIAGVSYASESESENLALRFQSIKRDGARAVIGILHTNLAGQAGHSNYAPCSKNDLAAAPVDYWALGHVHKRVIEEMGKNRYWAYPGNLQGRDADETGSKGALRVPILATGVGKPEFVACDVIRFHKIEVDCESAEDWGFVRDLVRQKISEIQSDSRPLVVRVKLSGQTIAHKAIAEVEKSGGAFSDLQVDSTDELNGGYIETLTVETSPKVEFEALISADDLRGDVLRTIKNMTIESLKQLVTAGVLDESLVEVFERVQNEESLFESLKVQLTRDALLKLVNDEERIK